VARPRRDAGVPSAHQRILDAFWRIYPDKPLTLMTVDQVCLRAKVTRATFYRHFANLTDVLDEIEDQAIPREVPPAIFSAASTGETTETVWQVLVDNQAQLGRLAALLSSRGDPRFARRLKDAMLTAFVTQMGGHVDDLTQQARFRMEFVISGFVGVLAYHGDTSTPFDPLPAMQAVWPMVAEHLIPILLEQTHTGFRH